MMQVILKWKVRVELQPPSSAVTFWISDNHLQNVLRAVARMDFGFQVPVLSITVTREPDPGTQGVELTTWPQNKAEGR